VALTGTRPGGVEGSRTIRDGVFTGAQARQGEAVVQSHCNRCHAMDGWPFVLEAWSGRPLVEFFETVQTTMPLDYPGELRPEDYAAVIAYVLRQSGAPAGERELPSDREVLAGITVTMRPSGG
jgi:mono/diheme cytochrome c family protein